MSVYFYTGCMLLAAILVLVSATQASFLGMIGSSIAMFVSLQASFQLSHMKDEIDWLEKKAAKRRAAA